MIRLSNLSVCSSIVAMNQTIANSFHSKNVSQSLSPAQSENEKGFVREAAAAAAG